MNPADVRAKRKQAGERLLVAWGLAIVPNALAAFGVDLPDDWWWHLVRFGLSAIWLLALIVWLVWLWRERRAGQSST